MIVTSNRASLITGLLLAIVLVLTASESAAQRIYDGSDRFIGKADNVTAILMAVAGL